MFAMLCTVVLSLACGWVLGGREREYRRTLGVGTALRNPGMAALLATSSFANTSVPAAVLVYLLIQFVVVSLVGVFFKRTLEQSESG
jgi:predicted Na+-dependent transporter